jgi:CRISPR system Cascade subunit CasE
MYLTKLPIIKGDDYCKHQVIKSIFPGDQKVLFQENNTGITVLSGSVCDNTSTEVDFLSYTNGNKYAFTIRLNPVRRDIKTKKRVSIDTQLVKEWIRNHLRLAGVEANFQYIREGTRRSVKQGKTVSFSSVLCFGVLTIINEDLFIESLKNGIGHGKGFGFGLINVF